MPKKLYNISQFHDGINEVTNPSDIKDGECVSAYDAAIHHVGKIVMAGDYSNLLSAHTASNGAGHGLYSYRTDKTFAGGDGGQELLLVSDKATSEIDAYDGSSWINGAIKLGTGTSCAPVYYVADGELRVCDSTFDSLNTSMWYGYIDRERFGKFSTNHGVTSYSTSILYDNSGDLAGTFASTHGLITGDTIFATVSTSSTPISLYTKITVINTKDFSLDDLSYNVSYTQLDYVTNDIADYPYSDSGFFDKINKLYTPTLSAINEYTTTYTDPSAGEITLNIEEVAGSGDWSGNYEFAISAVFDSKQETLVDTTRNYRLNDSAISPDYLAISAGTSIDLHFSINVSSTGDISERVSSYKIYAREVNSSSWVLLSTVDMDTGISNSGWGSIALHLGSGTGTSPTTHANIPSPINASTFESETGYVDIESANDLYAEYKTAVMAGRRVYIGNVKAYSEDGEFIEMSDAMYRSPINRFDIFYNNNKVEVAINDGESITALAIYGDRLLQFKDKTLYVINIAQDIEYLEATFDFMGVKSQSQVTATEYGIAFINDQGLYLFDGQRVRDLTDGDIGKRIDIPAFFYAGQAANAFSGSHIGYDRLNKQIVLNKDNSANETGTFIYDFRSDSFSYTPAGFPTVVMSNFVNNYDGNLVFAYGSSSIVVAKWDNAPSASTDFKWEGKYVDFGAPSLRKKVYKAYISHINSGSSQIKLYYRLNGSTNNSDWVDLGYLTNTTAYYTSPQEFSITGVPSAYSIQLKLDATGTAPSGFEVNDMAIVYRTKNAK